MRGTMRQRSKGTWELRVSLGRDPITGKYRERSRTIHGNKRAAEEALAALVTETSRSPRRRAVADTDMPLGELLDRHLDHIADDRSPTTMAGYRRRVAKRIKPALGTIPLRKLSAHDLDLYYRALRRRGRSPSDIHQDHAIIRGALNRAVDWGWLAENVAGRAHPPSVTHPDLEPPEPAAVAALIAAAVDEHPALAVFLRLAAATGARRGELCGLRWSDVDHVTSTLTIRRAIVEDTGRLIVKDTKTHAARRVALDDVTRALLADHLRAAHGAAEQFGAELVPEAYVFARDPDGSRPWSPQGVSQAYTKLRRKAGFGGRLHDLRHFHATRLLSAGVPIKQVSGRLGHSKASTTLDIYTAFIDAADADSATAIGRVLDG